MSSLSDHVAFFLGTHGPSLTLETACSSSLVAMAMAVAALRKGDCDYAIVTCVNIPQDKDFHLSLVRGAMIDGPRVVCVSSIFK
jgi:acyl transferase domain-containing protein